MDYFYWSETVMFYSAVEMSNLKQLVVKLDLYLLGNASLLPLTNFICASPCLERFVLEVLHLEPEFVKMKVEQIEGSYPQLKEGKDSEDVSDEDIVESDVELDNSDVVEPDNDPHKR